MTTECVLYEGLLRDHRVNDPPRRSLEHPRPADRLAALSVQVVDFLLLATALHLCFVIPT